jgi:AcrR family transcriptional regulator
MNNCTKSKRTQDAILRGALTILARDGAGSFTLDAIARESGVSKGGILYQFRTREAMVRAVVERQCAQMDASSQCYMLEYGTNRSQPQLAARIIALREAITGLSHAISCAIHGLFAQDRGLFTVSHERNVEALAAIRAEAHDPDLAILRWLAARGLMQLAMVEVNSLSDDDRKRLFTRLLDDTFWSAFEMGQPIKPKDFFVGASSSEEDAKAT